MLMKLIKIGKNRFFNPWKTSDLGKDKISSSNNNHLLIITTNRMCYHHLPYFLVLLCIIKILLLMSPHQLQLMAVTLLYLIVILILWLLLLPIIIGAAETSHKLRWIIFKLINHQKFNLHLTRPVRLQVWIRKWLLKMII